ncbi:MAG: 50S ribosomal protein L21 [bacterium]|nr:50S ribosomal protein L21 [bacterium]
MFAIIETGGKQYKVAKGETLDIERIDEKEGSTFAIDSVLLVSDKETKVGTPNVKGAKVSAKIVAHKRGDKIVVFKMKAKKRYQKTQGHRQELTTIEITDIKIAATKDVATTKTVDEKETQKKAAPKKKETSTKVPSKD